MNADRSVAVGPRTSGPRFVEFEQPGDDDLATNHQPTFIETETQERDEAGLNGRFHGNWSYDSHWSVPSQSEIYRSIKCLNMISNN